MGLRDIIDASMVLAQAGCLGGDALKGQTCHWVVKICRKQQTLNQVFNDHHTQKIIQKDPPPKTNPRRGCRKEGHGHWRVGMMGYKVRMRLDCWQLLGYSGVFFMSDKLYWTLQNNTYQWHTYTDFPTVRKRPVIHVYRGFIRKISLFWDRREALNMIIIKNYQ